ncbi:ubiquinone biosynthesis protein COQ9 [Azospirillum lipoferum]|uniref:COQ9 family protein n=1 Tax=Azospirillum lipoferum TaxID=193 RepID=A0A5A9GVV6_AZOLI|nr:MULTISPECIES: COQ9 family protein [Azospirillum]KAA0598453.1 COQ9 family protein [Azospirillum lipoferum]MCP1609551.1 ubiquinone biosynthesis protein COQ9 [Azospirillum lipoferum]MDW5535140.1 COQ9 family protein [Azospirillum sp. NL1]
MSIDTLRDEILVASLPNVVFDGWSLQSLRDGTGMAGHEPSALLRAFPGGVTDAVEHFADWSDRQMLDRLEALPLAEMKVRERISLAVRTYFEVLEPYREAKRRQLSYLALPQNVALGLRLLYRTVDAMWFAAGDSSTDYNHYTKRALLAAVVSSSTFYWLDDKSDDHAETRAFIDRRLADVLAVGKATSSVGKLGSMLNILPNPLRFARQMRQRSAGAQASNATVHMAENI